MDGAGDCERDDDWGGPRDQADTFGTVGFLDVCAVEELLILDSSQQQRPACSGIRTNVTVFGRLLFSELALWSSKMTCQQA